ncbi:hypothetical protein CEXT_29741 [Caerostris extrusa]|uniref:Uncharacterized protein n=1 Tax=Caerostris extrusa TaxID=172846 RepID=A0AAV4U5Z2_CAEEX|nr:hypothetical protein CEXT_29741 [Caerostris extrusa]
MDTIPKKATTSLKASITNAKGNTRPNDFSRPLAFNPCKALHHARSEQKRILNILQPPQKAQSGQTTLLRLINIVRNKEK